MGRDPILEKKLEQALWVAHSLFGRGKSSGSSGNLSFRHEDCIYVTASGSCFGTLDADDFSVLDMDGAAVSGKKPSKEWPLHLDVYKQSAETGAVIHTHSTCCVLWSFVPGLCDQDCVPDHTPYLKMKLGKVGLVPYREPGSEELFSAFRKQLPQTASCILKQHGPVVSGRTVMDAFYGLEELEESARIAWELYCAGLV